ncbi:hypothetical protein GQ457_17G025370 [Hibiscus cannabinus]
MAKEQNRGSRWKLKSAAAAALNSFLLNSFTGLNGGNKQNPAIKFHRKSDSYSGDRDEGGGWCGDISSCLERTKSGYGSSRYMHKWTFFSGILSDNASHNPDFYNWNRVKLRYCDGASFTGDGKLTTGGKRIWEAIVNDLLSKGLANAHQALLTGCSAGGLATFLHCDSFARMLPKASVKCLSDAGFFLDVKDVSLNYTIRSTFKAVVSLQGVKRNLDRRCRKSMYDPELCFFPQYTLKYITTPFFVLNSVYDAIQFHRFWVPYSADVGRTWGHCRHQLAACNADQIAVLQGFRHRMLKALSYLLKDKQSGGTFITSCLTHCQSNAQELWFAVDSREYTIRPWLKQLVIGTSTEEEPRRSIAGILATRAAT